MASMLPRMRRHSTIFTSTISTAGATPSVVPATAPATAVPCALQSWSSFGKALKPRRTHPSGKGRNAPVECAVSPRSRSSERSVESALRRDSAHQLFDLRGLALFAVARIRVSAVHALLAEARALPDEVVDRALQFGDAILEILRGRAFCHDSSGTRLSRANIAQRVGAAPVSPARRARVWLWRGSVVRVRSGSIVRRVAW